MKVTYKRYYEEAVEKAERAFSKAAKALKKELAGFEVEFVGVVEEFKEVLKTRIVDNEDEQFSQASKTFREVTLEIKRNSEVKALLKLKEEELNSVKNFV